MCRRAAAVRPGAAPLASPSAAQPAGLAPDLAPAPDLAGAPATAPAPTRRAAADTGAPTSVDVVASMYMGLDTACPAGGFFSSNYLWRHLEGHLAASGFQVRALTGSRLLPCMRRFQKALRPLAAMR